MLPSIDPNVAAILGLSADLGGVRGGARGGVYASCADFLRQQRAARYARSYLEVRRYRKCAVNARKGEKEKFSTPRSILLNTEICRPSAMFRTSSSRNSTLLWTRIDA